MWSRIDDYDQTIIVVRTTKNEVRTPISTAVCSATPSDRTQKVYDSWTR